VAALSVVEVGGGHDHADCDRLARWQVAIKPCVPGRELDALRVAGRSDAESTVQRSTGWPTKARVIGSDKHDVRALAPIKNYGWHAGKVRMRGGQVP
jgi:hypothetical protein